MKNVNVLVRVYIFIWNNKVKYRRVYLTTILYRCCVVTLLFSLCGAGVDSE